MAMFDYVNVKVNCPNCGHELDHFKTFNLGWSCNFSTVDASDVYDFMGACPVCDTRVDFIRDTPTQCKGEPKGIEYIESLGFKMSVLKLE